MAIFIRPIQRHRPQQCYRPRSYDPFEEDESFCHRHHPIAAMSPWTHVSTPLSMMAPSALMVPSTLPSTIASSFPSMLPDSIKNENGKFEIKCSIPGEFSPDELKLDLDGNKLILAGERKTSTSFQRIERIFVIPDGVEKGTLKCEFDPSTNQLCIEAASNAPATTKKIESNVNTQQNVSIENKKENVSAPESTEPIDTSNSESIVTPVPEAKPSEPPATSAASEEESKSPDTLSIKGKDYIERETDEGIEIDTTVSAA